MKVIYSHMLLVHRTSPSRLLSSKDVILSTVHETHSLVVSRRLAIRRVDVVAFSFYKELDLSIAKLLGSRRTVPDHHLLRTGNTLGRVITAVHGRLGLAQFLG